MKNQTNADYIKNFIFENKVVIMFAIIVAFAFQASGMSSIMFFNEMSMRFGRETFMVLALLIPVIAGLGLNFGIVLGAMAAQVAFFLVILLGGTLMEFYGHYEYTEEAIPLLLRLVTGIPGILLVAIVATPIAILFGFLVGKLFNSMKGSEMVGGMVTALFADGFYQLFFLFILGGVIPIAYTRIMTGTGVGVLNAINLDTYPTDMRQVIDNVPMLNILTIAFFVMLIYVGATLIYRFSTKRPITLSGEHSIKKQMILLAVLAIGYIASGIGGLVFQNELTMFLFQGRLNALMTVQWGSLIMVLLIFVAIILNKGEEKGTKRPVKQLVALALVTIVFALTFLPDFRASLEAGNVLGTFVPMLGLLTIAFYATLVWVILLVVRLRTSNKEKKATTHGVILFIKNNPLPSILLFVFGAIYIACGIGGLVFQNGLTVSLSYNGFYIIDAIRWALLISVILMNVIIRKKGHPGIPYKPLVYLILVGLLFSVSFITYVYIGLQNLGLPVLTYLLIFLLCLFIKWFMNTRLGQNMRTVGQSRPVATAAGIHVDKTRLIAMIISTLLAAYGYIIITQNFGVMNTYSGHRFVGQYAIAALLVGGATVTKASVKHAILGVILFHSLFILAPAAGTNLTGNSMIGEYFRLFISYTVISIALIMHAWHRVKKRKEKEA